jgi:hypothetical protein
MYNINLFIENVPVQVTANIPMYSHTSEELNVTGFCVQLKTRFAYVLPFKDGNHYLYIGSALSHSTFVSIIERHYEYSNQSITIGLPPFPIIYTGGYFDDLTKENFAEKWAKMYLDIQLSEPIDEKWGK